jgi:hypothetical protein
MEKVDVNEYVRTKDGIIDKVIIEYDGKCNNPNCSEKHISCKYNYYNEKDIVKNSKQLIDLIEVGDIVKDKYNKYEVAFVKGDKIYCNDYNLDDSLITLREQDIKEILAREQFEANCYKVGGEE